MNIILVIDMNKINKLNSTAGRFSTLITNKNGKRNVFCAKILSATEKFVAFFDVNAGVNRRVPTENVAGLRSGKLRFATA